MGSPLPAAPETLDVCLVAGRFEVLRPLGVGATARVDLARSVFDGMLCALKRAPLADSERCEMLQRELRLRLRVAHPQIPALVDFGQDRELGCAFVAMELESGGDLTQGLTHFGAASLPLLLAQALNVLEFLHGRGVIHADVKPENMSVSGVHPRSPLLKLLDFGLSRELSESAAQPPAGTPAFMAPSLLRGEAASAASDLFSLGRSFQVAFKEAFPEGSSRDAEAAAIARPVLERLTRADADLAYPSASAALADLARRLDAGYLEKCLPRPIVPLFCGRHEELRSLRGSLSALEESQLDDQLILIEGEQGSGKSRLLSELWSDAVLAGLNVVRLSCHRTAHPCELPYKLARRLQPEGSSERETLASLCGMPPSSGANGKVALSQGLLRDLVQSLQEPRSEPVLILIDDLDLADEPTLALVRLLAELPSKAGPLVVVTRTAGCASSAAHGALDHASRASLMPLEKLSVAELEQLIASITPRAESISDLASLSEGRPGLAALLAGAGSSLRTDHDLQSAEVLDALLGEKLARHDEAEREVLCELAVLSQPVSLAFLRELGPLSSTRLPAQLERLAVSGLVHYEKQEAGRLYALTSERLRRLLLSTQTDEKSAARHARMLAAWESWPVPQDRSPEMLVEHSIGAGETERALVLGLPAVATLAERGSLQAAERLVRRLLPLVPEQDRERKAVLINDLGEILLRSGRPQETRGLLEPDDADGGGDGDRDSGTLQSEDRHQSLRLLRTLGGAAEAGGDPLRAIEILRSAHALCDAQTEAVERLRVLERLGTAYFRLGRLSEARESWLEGLAQDHGEDCLAARADVLNDLGNLESEQGRLACARTRHLEALCVRRARGDLDGEARSLTNLANLALKEGELGCAAELYRDSLALKRQVGSLQSQAVSLGNLALLHVYLGRYDQALSHYEKSLDLRSRTHDRLGEARMLRDLALLLLEKGEWSRSCRELARCRELLDSTRALETQEVPLLAAEAEWALETGALELAASKIDSALRALERSERRNDRPLILQLRGRLRGLTGDTEASIADLGAALEALPQPASPWETAWGRLHLGHALAQAGQLQSARAELEAATGLARAHDTPRILAAALMQRARLELAAGEHARAAALAGEALPIAQRLALPSLVLVAWSLKASLALASGLSVRARLWWSKCAELLEQMCRELPDKRMQAALLELPVHLEIVHGLHQLVEIEETVRRG